MEILKKEKQEMFIQEVTEEEVEFLKFIQDVEENYMLKAPRGLKENILRDSQRVRTQVVVQSRKMSARVQLFLYGMKISIAVVTALFLLSIVDMDVNLPVPKDEGYRQPGKKITQTLQEQSNALSTTLNNLTKKLWKE